MQSYSVYVERSGIVNGDNCFSFNKHTMNQFELDDLLTNWVYSKNSFGLEQSTCNDGYTLVMRVISHEHEGTEYRKIFYKETK